MPRAVLGEAPQRLFLDPGHELVRAEMVGQRLQQGAVGVEPDLLLPKLGGPEDLPADPLHLAPQRAHPRGGVFRSAPGRRPTGLESVHLVRPALDRLKAVPPLPRRQIEKGRRRPPRGRRTRLRVGPRSPRSRLVASSIRAAAAASSAWRPERLSSTALRRALELRPLAARGLERLELGLYGLQQPGHVGQVRVAEVGLAQGSLERARRTRRGPPAAPRAARDPARGRRWPPRPSGAARRAVCTAATAARSACSAAFSFFSAAAIAGARPSGTFGTVCSQTGQGSPTESSRRSAAAACWRCACSRWPRAAFTATSASRLPSSALGNAVSASDLPARPFSSDACVSERARSSRAS